MSPVCEGAGVKTLEMQFLAPVEIVCDECGGRRFNPETLEIRFKDYDVAQILDMTVEDALELFAAFPKIARPLETLRDVGLGYVKLGQPSTTLSGGEAQRVKLATELHRPAADGKTIYLCDEPTTGLHTHDVRKLLGCLQRLVDAGNTVVVIEHNLDVIAAADWILDLGPEGGPGGGRLVAEGTPEAVAAHEASRTGLALRPVLERARPKAKRKTASKAGRKKASKAPRRLGVRTAPPTHIEVRGARQNNLQGIDVDIPINEFTVVTGVSGSGKTSLAFDTLFSEGQRRFVESLSTYARRYLGRLDRAPVDRLDGLGPAIAIDQKASSRSPRSTVATATEIHDYLRLLYARIGRPHCANTACDAYDTELVGHAPTQIATAVRKDWPGQAGYVLAPIQLTSRESESKRVRQKHLDTLVADWRERGFVRALVDGEEVRLDAGPIAAPKNGWPELYLVVDRLSFKERTRLVDSAAQAAEFGQGRVVVRTRDGDERVFTIERSCASCGFSVPDDPHPRYFSFNHHSGACPECSGLGRIARCDPELLVNHPQKPLFDGAIQHKGMAFTFLTKKSGWYGTIAKAVAKRYGFKLSIPFDELSEDARRVLLFGAGEDELFDVVFTKSRRKSARRWETQAVWRGLCTQIEEWALGTSSDGGEVKEGASVRYGVVMREADCPACGGERLGPAQRHVTLGGVSLPEFSRLTVHAARAAIGGLKLRKNERAVAEDALREVENRLAFLDSVGLGYLTLDRSAATLSGGEAQRIRLATQLGNRLVGVLYVLDEPTIGLHPRDTEQLLGTLRDLRDLGNTVVAVEHDDAVDPGGGLLASTWGPVPGQARRPGGCRPRPPATRIAEALGRVQGVADRGQYLRGELAHADVPDARPNARAAGCELRGSLMRTTSRRLDVDVSARRLHRGDRRVRIGQVVADSSTSCCRVSSADV